MNFVFNVKGLTAADRAQWEKDNIEALKGTDYFAWNDSDRDRAFRDASFKNKYGSREDYNTLYSYTPEQRDSLFNIDLNPEQGLGEFAEATQIYENTLNKATKWHKAGEEAKSKLDEIASSLNPYYERYLGTNYLPWTEEDKIKAYARYESMLGTYGKEVADKDLSDTITRQVSKNQENNFGGTDIYLRGFNNFGASLVGSTLNFMGFIGGLVASPYFMVTEGENGPTRDLNALQSYLHYVVNNPMTEYGDRIIKRGTFDPRVLTSNDPKDDWNRNEIIHTPEENESNWDFVFSKRFIPELMSTSGFSTAAILEGQALSWAGRSLYGWRMAKAANNITSTEQAVAALDKLKNLAKWERRYHSYVVPSLVGTGEGVINALGTYDSSLQNSMNLIDQAIYDKAQSIKQSLLDNPELMQELGYDAIDEQSLELQIMQSLAPEREDMIRKANEEAAEAELMNLGFNSIINGAANVLLKSPMFGGRVKEAASRSLGNSRVGRLFASDAPSFTYSGGRVEAVVPSTLSKVIEPIKETFGEMSEEYLQDISDVASQGKATNSMENFIARRLNGESYEAIEDNFADNMGAALVAAGNHLTSKEAIRSAIMGGFSQAFGNATINTQAFSDARNSKTATGKVGNFIRAFYRNPFVESFREARAEKDARTRAAETFNEWLNEGNRLDMLNGINGAVNWIREMNEYNEQGDEFSYKNSKTGKLINDAFMIHELKGTELYDAYVQQFMDVLNIEEGTEEATNAIKNSGMSLEDTKKHAQQMLTNLENVEKELSSLEEVLGKHVDPEVKKALVYGKLSYLDWETRGEELDTELKEGANTEKSSKELSRLARRASNRFRIEAVEKEIDKLETKINTAENNKAILSKNQKQELKENKKQLEQLIDIQKSLTEGVEEENSLLTVHDLIHLNPIERYRMLNPKNRKLYTQEQLDEIDSLVEGYQIYDPKFMQKVEDSARIEEAKRTYLQQYISALKDPSNLNKIAMLLKAGLAVDQLKKKYSYLNSIANKNEFIAELDKQFEEAKDTLSRETLLTTVKDNNFFKEIMQTQEDTEDFNILKEYNEQYQKMEDKQKKQIEGVLAFLETKNLNPKDLEAQEYIANNPQELEDYVNSLNTANPENQIEFENAGDLIGAFQELFGILAEEEREKVNVEKRDEDTQVSSVEAPAPVVVDNNADEEKEKSEEQDLEEKDEDKKLNPVLENAINIVKNNPLYKDKVDAIIKLLSDIDSSIDRNKVVEELLNTKTDDVLEQVIIGDIIKILQGNTYTINAQEGKTNNREVYKAIINLLTARELEANDDYTSLRNFYTIYEIDRYLQTAMLSQKDKIRFVYDPTLASQVKSDKQERFAEIDTPIIAVVFTGNGPLEIEGKKGYQPIGVLPNVQGKEEMIKAIKGNSRQFIRIEDSIVETTINGYIHTKAPEQIPRTEPNMPIAVVAFNDESPATKEAYEQSSIEEKTTLQKALRDKILNHLVYVEENSPNTHTKEAHLAYEDTDGRQNVTSQIDVTIAFPEETVTIDGKSFKDVLLNGTDEDLLRYNSRVYGIKSPFEPEGYGLGNVIRQFFEATPFKNIREGDTKALEELSEKLRGVITNYISLPTSGQYKIVIEPTTETRGGFPVYSLRLKGPSRLINNGANTVKVDYNYELGKVYDGTLSDNEVASIIRNIFLDENKNFRKYSYKGKEMPLIKWQVNISDFNRGKNAGTSAASKHREDVYNDNILTISKRSLRRQVTEVPIHNPIRKSSNNTKPDLSIANTDNAEVGSTGGPIIAAGQSDAHNGIVEGETGVPLEGKPDNIPDDTVKRTLEAVRRIKEGARKILRRTDGKGYTSGSSTLSRVTSIIKDKSEQINRNSTVESALSEFFKYIEEKETSDNRKNIVKSLDRTALINTIANLDKINHFTLEQVFRDFNLSFYWNNRYSVGLANLENDLYIPTNPATTIGTAVDEFFRETIENKESVLDNTSEEDTKKFKEEILNFKQLLKNEGFSIIAELDYPDGTIDGVRTKGFLEVQDKDGNIHKIEVSGTLDLLAYNPKTGKFRIYDMKTMRNPNNLNDKEYQESWGRQLLLYKTFLENEYGIDIESTHIIPIQVEYSNLNYTSKGNQLYVKDVAYKGASPKMLDIINIDTSKYKFVLSWDSLSKESQEELMSKLPEGTEGKGVKNGPVSNSRRGRGGLSRGKINSAAALGMTDEMQSEVDKGRGSRVIDTSNMSFYNITELLDKAQLEALKERFERLTGKEFNKENWEDIPKSIRETNVKCIRG